VKNAGLWFGLLLLVFSGIIFWESLSLEYDTAFGPGPGFLPLWLSGLLMAMSLIYIWQSVKKDVIRFAQILPRGRALRHVLSALASLLAFLVLAPLFGFTIGAIALLFIVLVREYKWYVAAGIASVISIALFFLFQSLLGVPLPVNELGW